MSINRGLIANPGFIGTRVRGVYFFAGNWRYTPPGQPAPLFYECTVVPNDEKYTVHPSDARHLGWSEALANRDFAVQSMLEAGANTVVMSFWGERGTDRWAAWAPMQTSTIAHDQLFDAVAGRALLIMPAIESGAATKPSGNSDSYYFSQDFPGTPVDPAPALVKQVVDLVNRYLLNSDHPEWAGSWVQLFDRNGVPRHAINIIHVASSQIPADADSTFAAGFDWVLPAELTS